MSNKKKCGICGRSEKYIRVSELGVSSRNPAAFNDPERAHGWNDLLKIVQSATAYTPAEIMAGMWVLAEEEMPDIGDEVLIRIDHDVMPVYYDMAEYEGEGVFRTHFGHLLYMEVTHWMPLPQPPKEANHDK